MTRPEKIPEILQEAIELGDIDGCELIKARISQILSEPVAVPQKRYETYYKALGRAYKANDDEFLDGREEVLEDEEMQSIDDDLYAEMADRMELPKEEDEWVEMLVDAWDEALEIVVIPSYVPED